MSKTITCYFLHGFSVDTCLFCWAGCLEYSGRRKFFGGAKMGLSSEELLQAALADLFGNLKEPVAVQLVTVPPIDLGDSVFANASFVDGVDAGGDMPESLVSLFSDVEAVAQDVLEQRKYIDVAGAFFVGLEGEGDWLSCRQIDGGISVDFHKSLFIAVPAAVVQQELF